jgi:hypothetical protein
MGERHDNHTSGNWPAAFGIIFGWYAVAVAAVIAWVSQLSTVKDPQCASFCFSEQERGTFAGLFLGIPSAVVALLVSIVALYVLARRWRPGFVVGIGAALVGSVIAPVVVAGVVMIATP